MKLESTLDRRPALLHLAPVLDVMALMVVFYLLGSNLIHHSGLGVKLPVSSSQLPALTSSHVVLVTAGDPPMVLFDRTQMDYAALIDRLREGPIDGRTAVYLKMDRRVANGVSVEVVNAALSGGFQAYLATSPRGDEAQVVGGTDSGIVNGGQEENDGETQAADAINDEAGEFGNGDGNGEG